MGAVELLDLIERGRPCWHEHAACRGQGPARWFLERHDGGEVAGYGPAREVCASCPVAEQCAEAGHGEEHGLWGGLTPRQRRGRTATARRARPRATGEPCAGGCGRGAVSGRRGLCEGCYRARRRQVLATSKAS